MKGTKETGSERNNEIKKSLIFYLNDDNTSISAYVELIEIGQFVVFKTNDNIIRLPSGRVLKIKEKL